MSTSRCSAFIDGKACKNQAIVFRNIGGKLVGSCSIHSKNNKDVIDKKIIIESTQDIQCCGTKNSKQCTEHRKFSLVCTEHTSLLFPDPVIPSSSQSNFKSKCKQCNCNITYLLGFCAPCIHTSFKNECLAHPPLANQSICIIDNCTSDRRLGLYCVSHAIQCITQNF